ncbi:MAG TPA: hypothetical protein VG651_08465 [Stellaceae bacterium]|nr:hypothetical protein [Stellaceae bacterium]
MVVGHGWRRDHLPVRDGRVSVRGPVEDLGAVFDRVRLMVAPWRADHELGVGPSSAAMLPGDETEARTLARGLGRKEGSCRLTRTARDTPSRAGRDMVIGQYLIDAGVRPILLARAVSGMLHAPAAIGGSG